jgi:hypothetical protein
MRNSDVAQAPTESSEILAGGGGEGLYFLQFYSWFICALQNLKKNNAAASQ